MSYIKGSCECEVCNNEIDYAWLLSDGVIEKIPEKIIAKHNKKDDKYEISVKCLKCGNVICFEYSLDGKYIGKRG